MLVSKGAHPRKLFLMMPKIEVLGVQMMETFLLFRGVENFCRFHVKKCSREANDSLVKMLFDDSQGPFQSFLCPTASSEKTVWNCFINHLNTSVACVSSSF